MKPIIATVILGLGLCRAALATPSAIYYNYSTLDIRTGSKAPVVDATAFCNEGYFEVDTAFTSLGLSLGDTIFPFTTQDTLFYTNTSSGVMTGSPGYRFDYTTASNRYWSSIINNQGTMIGVDVPVAAADPYSPSGGATFTPSPADNQPLTSQLLMFATNIQNLGTMSVGNIGLLQLYGINVSNTSGAMLLQGAVDTGSLNFDPLDTTGGRPPFVIEGDGQAFCVDAPQTYDLFWAAANGAAINLQDLSSELPNTSGGAPINATGRNGAGMNRFGMPVNNIFNDNEWACYTNEPVIVDNTNIYFTFVMVNTNLLALNNITTTVEFGNVATDTAGGAPYNQYGTGVGIQFAESVYDPITGNMVTNAVYLLDSGAYDSAGATLLDNTSYAEPYSRPNVFDVTTTTPTDWFNLSPGLSSTIAGIEYWFYAPGSISSVTVPANIATYGVQIGRNPETLGGGFEVGLQGDSLVTNTTLVAPQWGSVVLVDPGADLGRININANNLDLTGARIRAEGTLVINATNLVGAGTGAADFGQSETYLGASNGTMVVSNFFPTNFQRVRGNIYAWEANWTNVETNTADGPATNNFFYHLLIVDQNLEGSFIPTARNITLAAKNSVTVEDNLYVINQALFNTSNLTLNGTNTFTGNAGNLGPTNMPELKNLFIGTNGVLEVDNSLFVGFSADESQSSPAGRKYTVNSITNLGTIESSAPILDAAMIENDGTVEALNGGSILIQASTLGMGLVLTNGDNSFSSFGNVSLSANVIEATNSTITAGGTYYSASAIKSITNSGSLILYAPSELSDMVSGVATTNTNSVIVNHWTANGGGFSMPVKPAAGDLFGTEITTIVSGYQEAVHVWAGQDYGLVNGLPNTQGFSNNTVIGRLVLDRESSTSVLHFSAAGAKNAMYVDYLELEDYALNDYRHGLVIDPNMTIYFADSNGDPVKLMEIYPQLVWAQNFNGPNSTQVIPYENSSNVCLMNAALANSTEISFWNSIPNYYLLQQTPYLLNDPTDPSIIYPCPGEQTSETPHSLLVTTRQITNNETNLTLNLVTITHNGEGTVTPALKASALAMGGTYSLTAKPSNGWVFASWSAIGLPLAVNLQTPVLKFTLQGNTVITANFVPNPFASLAGSYNGLFLDTNANDASDSGFMSLTLAQSGSFSGDLLMGPSKYTFSSRLSASGAAQVQAKFGAASLAVNLQLDMSGLSGRIYGDVNGGSWDAPLAADLAPAWKAASPSPLEGHYTLSLPWETGADGEPGGDSYGVASVASTGVLSVGGVLADGVAFSASAPVSKNGQWPFYTYAPTGKDTVLGWVTVDASGLTGTNMIWAKVGAFTNTLQLVGSQWQAPAAKTPALSLASPVVVLTGGGLTESLTNGVSMSQYLTYATTNLTLTINSTTGSFSGWFVNPDTGHKVTVSGVVLQNEASGLGFFVGTNESGAVLLQDP